MQQSHFHKEPLNIIQLLQKEKKMPKSSYLFLNISPLITLEFTSSNLEYCSQSSSYNRKKAKQETLKNWYFCLIVTVNSNHSNLKNKRKRKEKIVKYTEIGVLKSREEN